MFGRIHIVLLTLALLAGLSCAQTHEEAFPEARDPRPSICPAANDVAQPEGMHPGDVLAVIKAHLPDIDACCDRHAWKSTNVRLTWLVDCDGAVLDAKTLTGSARDTPLGQCMEAAIRNWTFPSYAGARIPPVVFPFVCKKS